MLWLNINFFCAILIPEQIPEEIFNLIKGPEGDLLMKRVNLNIKNEIRKAEYTIRNSVYIFNRTVHIDFFTRRPDSSESVD